LYNDGTISSFKIEYYDISYITGSPTQISPESGDVPLTTPGYVETQFSQTETEFPPDEPSNPNPGHGAINVDINIDLSWTGGDPDIGDTVEYDIYFGTTTTPPFIGTVTTQSYDPGTLSYSILYYWQIVSRDNHGYETTGSIWSFTTKDEPSNTPPDVPSNPIPANEAIDVPLNPTLSVFVNDIDGDTMTISFYEQGGSLIGTDIIIGSGTAITTFTNADQYSTPYNWYTVTDDIKDIITSPTWSFATKQAQPDNFYANQDIIIQNKGIIGSYIDTWSADDNHESIKERESGGKPSNRHSYLEHKWIIPVTGGLESYVFYLEAYHTTNSEGDDFLFEYSTNDVNYNQMITVTKTSDDNSYQIFSLPTSMSGDIYIRVKDTDQTRGNRVLDTIYIDHMYILGSGTPPPNNPPTAGFTCTTTDLTAYFTDTSTDSDGTIVDWSWNFGDGVGTSSAQNPSYTYASDGTYTVSLTVIDNDGATDSTFQSVTVTGGGTGSDMWVSGISWRTKSAGRNLFLYHKITVMSDDGPVSSATVDSTLSGPGGPWYFPGITDSNGQVEFSLKTSSSGSYTAFVTDITHASYTYNLARDIGNPSTYNL